MKKKLEDAYVTTTLRLGREAHKKLTEARDRTGIPKTVIVDRLLRKHLPEFVAQFPTD